MTAKLWSLQEHLSLLTSKVGEMPAVRSFDKFPLRQPFPKPKRRCIWELSSAVFTVPSSAPAWRRVSCGKSWPRLRLQGFTRNRSWATRPGRAAGWQKRWGVEVAAEGFRSPPPVSDWTVQQGTQRGGAAQAMGGSGATRRDPWRLLGRPDPPRGKRGPNPTRLGWSAHALPSRCCANRADVRRLRELETEKAALQKRSLVSRSSCATPSYRATQPSPT